MMHLWKREWHHFNSLDRLAIFALAIIILAVFVGARQ